MPAIINSDDGVVSGSAGLKTSGANDGILAFQNNGTEQARITAAGLFQFNSGYGSVATAYGCRAWVNFNGTGTVAIRASGNVTSITDNGVGDYTVNMTTAMPDTNYAFTGTLGPGSASSVVCLAENNNTTRTASLFRIYTSIQGATLIDAPAVMISIFR